MASFLASLRIPIVFLAVGVWLFNSLFTVFNLPIMPNTVTSPNLPETPSKYPLTETQIEAFKRDGWFILKDFVPEVLKERMVQAKDEFVTNPNFECSITQWLAPSGFQRYPHFCIAPCYNQQPVWQEAVYRLPMGHIIHQIAGVDTARNLLDTLMGGEDLPDLFHFDYSAFTHGEEAKQRVDPCDNGLVFWLPLEKSWFEKNGLQLVNGSHHITREWDPNFMLIPSKARFDAVHEIARDPKSTISKPTLEFGDAIVFNQCTIHTSSGVSRDGPRMAYQVRVEVNPSSTAQTKASRFWPQSPGGITIEEKQLYPQMWPAFKKEEVVDITWFKTVQNKAGSLASVVKAPVYMTGSAFVKKSREMKSPMLYKVGQFLALNSMQFKDRFGFSI